MNAEVDDLTCQELVEVLTEYLGGVVDARTRADIERHIVFCRGCANYVEQMHSTIDLLSRVAAEEPGDEPTESLLALFRGWRDERAGGAPLERSGEP